MGTPIVVERATSRLGKVTDDQDVAQHVSPVRALIPFALAATVAAACGGTGDAAGTDGTTPEDLLDLYSGPATNAPAPPSDVGVPPDVDLDIHDVPLDEIYFDTFDGGSVRLADSTPELRAELLDAIPPIDDPAYGGIDEGEWLEPDDFILGYEAGGMAFAYPFKILNFREIINDVIDGVPVLISYCPLCGSGIVYDRRVRDDVLSFGNTSALYESDLVMVDRTTGSYWWQVAGAAIVGTLTGTRLEVLPSVVSTWRDWSAQHPDTLVLSRTTGYVRPYERNSFANYAEYLDGGKFAFPVGDAARDERLRPSARVVGIVVGDSVRAYPIERMDGPINDVVAGLPVLVLPVDEGAAVLNPVVDGATLVFEQLGETVVDQATGSTWTADGVAVAGELAGTRLEAFPSRTTFWFAFVGAFPNVELFGG